MYSAIVAIVLHTILYAQHTVLGDEDLLAAHSGGVYTVGANAVITMNDQNLDVSSIVPQGVRQLTFYANDPVSISSVMASGNIGLPGSGVLPADYFQKLTFHAETPLSIEGGGIYAQEINVDGSQEVTVLSSMFFTDIFKGNSLPIHLSDDVSFSGYSGDTIQIEGHLDVGNSVTFNAHLTLTENLQVEASQGDFTGEINSQGGTPFSLKIRNDSVYPRTIRWQDSIGNQFPLNEFTVEGVFGRDSNFVMKLGEKSVPPLASYRFRDITGIDETLYIYTEGDIRLKSVTLQGDAEIVSSGGDIAVGGFQTVFNTPDYTLVGSFKGGRMLYQETVSTIDYDGDGNDTNTEIDYNGDGQYEDGIVPFYENVTFFAEQGQLLFYAGIGGDIENPSADNHDDRLGRIHLEAESIETLGHIYSKRDQHIYGRFIVGQGVEGLSIVGLSEEVAVVSEEGDITFYDVISAQIPTYDSRGLRIKGEELFIHYDIGFLDETYTEALNALSLESTERGIHLGGGDNERETFTIVSQQDVTLKAMNEDIYLLKDTEITSQEGSIDLTCINRSSAALNDVSLVLESGQNISLDSISNIGHVEMRATGGTSLIHTGDDIQASQFIATSENMRFGADIDVSKHVTLLARENISWESGEHFIRGQDLILSSIFDQNISLSNESILLEADNAEGSKEIRIDGSIGIERDMVFKGDIVLINGDVTAENSVFQFDNPSTELFFFSSVNLEDIVFSGDGEIILAGTHLSLTTDDAADQDYIVDHTRFIYNSVDAEIFFPKNVVVLSGSIQANGFTVDGKSIFSQRYDEPVLIFDDVHFSASDSDWGTLLFNSEIEGVFPSEKGGLSYTAYTTIFRHHIGDLLPVDFIQSLLDPRIQDPVTILEGGSSLFVDGSFQEAGDLWGIRILTPLYLRYSYDHQNGNDPILYEFSSSLVGSQIELSDILLDGPADVPIDVFITSDRVSLGGQVGTATHALDHLLFVNQTELRVADMDTFFVNELEFVEGGELFFEQGVFQRDLTLGRELRLQKGMLALKSGQNLNIHVQSKDIYGRIKVEDNSYDPEILFSPGGDFNINFFLGGSFIDQHQNDQVLIDIIEQSTSLPSGIIDILPTVMNQSGGDISSHWR